MYTVFKKIICTVIELEIQIMLIEIVFFLTIMIASASMLGDVRCNASVQHASCKFYIVHLILFLLCHMCNILNCHAALTSQLILIRPAAAFDRIHLVYIGKIPIQIQSSAGKV